MRLILFSVVVLSGLLTTSQDQQASGYVSLLERTYARAHSLRAVFLEQYSENGQLVRAEAGTAYFHRPGKMRWEYESPEKSVFVVDGKTSWFYVPADRTVTRVPARKSEDWRTPFAFLMGQMKVSRLCSRVELVPRVTPLVAGAIVLRCIPKGSRNNIGQEPTDPAVSQRILLEVSPASGELLRVSIEQAAGSSIEFRFRDWVFNPPLPESLFHFQPPPGVAIVNGELPAHDAAVIH